MSRKQHDLESAFDPSFGGGRQERAWILEALGGLYVEEWFTDVLFRVKGGKEATVYGCRAHPGTGLDLVAAKVFRPRIFRAMKNDALYKQARGTLDLEGKPVRDSRSARALAKKTRYGKVLDAISWCQHEYKTLETLHQAGVDVPRPLVATQNAILMEFVGDESGAAPVLQDVSLAPDEAERVLAALLEDVNRMLSCFVIHADLSAYNVLYHEGRARVIDLPQTVDALAHPRAFELFQRDVDRLARYFVRQGVSIDADRVARETWSRWLG